MREKYKNPPIKEAVCEFRFRSEGTLDIAVPGLVYNALREEFPDRVHSPINLGQLGITFGSIRLGNPQEGSTQGGMGEAIRVVQGLRFWRKDSLDGVITLGQDRLSISHYEPYRSWESFRPDILKAFAAYKIEANPDSIQRIGLRYINEIHFDQAIVEPEEYFNYYPHLGANLPQNYSGLNMMVQFPYEDDRDRLRLSLTTSRDSENTGLIARLDLDYSVLESGTVHFDDVPGWLEIAHGHIEDVFESCLTDKVRLKF
jgi:uncharacterized protein (TIGR04255 family)